MTSPTARPPAPTLRDRKRDRTHDDLARAAFALAKERGLDGFTVDEVAERADVSRRTFFNHFQSKEEAVSEVARVQVTAALDQGKAMLVAEGLVDAQGTGCEVLGAGGLGLEADEAAGSTSIVPSMRPLLLASVSHRDQDEATYKLHVVVNALLGEETIDVFRDLTSLAEASRALAPHLAAIQVSIVDQAAELLRTNPPGGDFLPVPPVYAHALPGAVAATMWAVYSGQIEVVELGGSSPTAVSVTELVEQLRSLVPESLMPPSATSRPAADPSPTTPTISP